MLRRRREEGIRASDFLQFLLDLQKEAQGSPDRTRIGTRTSKVTWHDLPNKVTWYDLPDNEIVGNALMLMLASHETIATALTFVMHNLVNHQSVQDRLRAEIQGYLRETGGEIDYGVVNELPFLDGVLNESLRLFPPAPTFGSRKAALDYKYGDITIPAGAHVIIPVWTIHHDERYWPEPNKFKPERFLPENRSSIVPFTFLPFGKSPLS